MLYPRIRTRQTRMALAISAVLTIFLGQALAAQTALNRGEVQIYVFAPNGLPQEGVTVIVDDVPYESGPDGLINFTHPAGTHVFELLLDGRVVGRVEAPVRQNRVTEVIVTASTQPAPSASAPAAAGAAEDPETADDDAPRTELDPNAPQGRLIIRVTALETGQPISGATVIFRGINLETATDEDGEAFADLPEGTYSFSVIDPDYSTQTRDDVVISADEDTEVALRLTPSAVQLDEVQVFATEQVVVQGGIANLIEETRNSGFVLNLIGSEQISRTGDSDAASALRRVTGLTIADGRFVYVRGMGERYSSSQLNGARLPSPEPDRRVVPLDLFPTSIIESIAVQKTFSPDLPADFGGGVVAIRSAGIPDDRYDRRLRVNVGSSVAWNEGATFTERLVEVAGPLDFLGFDLGQRALPQPLEDEEREILLETGGGIGFARGIPADELEALAESLPNTWQPFARTLLPDIGLSASVRDKFQVPDGGEYGYNIAALYSNGWSYQSQRLLSYIGDGTGGLGVSSDYTVDRTSRDADIGFLFDFAYEPDAFRSLEATTLVIHATDGTTQQLGGLYVDDSVDLGRTEISWVQQLLLSQSLQSSRVLPNLNGGERNFRYSFGWARRYEPDSRYVSYWDETADGEFEAENQVLSPRQYAAGRFWTSVNDFLNDAQVSWTFPIDFGGGGTNFMDIGVYGLYQIRFADTRRFIFTYVREEISTFEDILSLDPSELFTEEYIGYSEEEILEFEESTENTDRYNGQQIIGAAYGTMDLVFGGVRANIGLRAEYSLQSVATIDLDGTQLAPFVLQSTLFPLLTSLGLFTRPETGPIPFPEFLPSINFTLPTTERSQMRLGFSKTVNRPDLRELSPAPRYGPPGTGVTRGNPDLASAQILNADARWEIYFTETESISLGGFYKYFVNPIENIQFYGAEFAKSFTNVPFATNFGGEFEWAFQLRPVSDLLRIALLNLNFNSLERERRWRRTLGAVSQLFRDLRTTGNVSLINSEINFGDQTSGSNTSVERPLQGQAPYVVNAALGYRNTVSFSQYRPIHTSIFLNYNLVGPRISVIGTDQVPDQYLQPTPELNLVFRQQLGFIPSFSIEIGNILDPPVLETIGPTVDGENIVQESRRGRSVSVSFSLDI